MLALSLQNNILNKKYILVLVDDLNKFELLQKQNPYFKQTKNRIVNIKNLGDKNIDDFLKNVIFIFHEILIINFDKKAKIKIPFIYDLIKNSNAIKKFNNQKIFFEHYIVKDKLLNGKKVFESTILEYYRKFNNKDNHFDSKKVLAIIQVGNDFASTVYIKNKISLASRIHINAKLFAVFENKNTEQKLIELIDKLNKDDTIGGILLQLPLPKWIDSQKIINLIDPKKDVDCFNNANLGLIFQNNVKNDLYPCTPKGIIYLLESYGISLKSKKIVIVNRSNIVGRPLSFMALNKDATVTICHSKTKNLKAITKTADILISGIGKAKFFDDSYIKKNCICVDVSINRDKNNKLSGDFDFEKVYHKVKYITPVPYGVGPMTLLMLMDNFILLNSIKKSSNKLN